MFKHKLKENGTTGWSWNPIRSDARGGSTISNFPGESWTFPKGSKTRTANQLDNLTSSFLNLQGLKPFPWKSKERPFQKTIGNFTKTTSFLKLWQFLNHPKFGVTITLVTLVVFDCQVSFALSRIKLFEHVCPKHIHVPHLQKRRNLRPTVFFGGTNLHSPRRLSSLHQWITVGKAGSRDPSPRKWATDNFCPSPHGATRKQQGDVRFMDLPLTQKCGGLCVQFVWYFCKKNLWIQSPPWQSMMP